MPEGHNDLRQAYERAVELLEATLAEPELDPEQARIVLREMMTIVEELKVTDEELRVQSEQLAASAAVIDAERARFAELFDAAPDAYVETDRHGKIIEANRAAERMFGVPRRLLYGKLLVTFVDEVDRRRLRQRLNDPEAAGEMLLGMEARHGRRFDAALTIAEGSSESVGDVYRWIFRDVTRRLALEEEVTSLSERLGLSNSVVELSRLTSRSDPLPSMLGEIAELAKSVTGSAEVGMTLLERTHLEPRIATGALARELDARQRAVEAGPCFEAIREQRLVHGPASGWPVFAGDVDAGALAHVVAVPLGDGDAPVGALNVYAPEPVDDRTVALIVQVAEQCAVAFENARILSSAGRLAAELTEALENRGDIEQAKGLIMARNECDADGAIDILKRASQRENVKLRDIAKRIVDHANAASEVDLRMAEPQPGPNQ